jgi:hypothetical protein
MTIRTPRVLAGSHNAPAAVSSTAYFKGEGSFWVYGTFVGTVQLEVSPDGGANWVAVHSMTGPDRKLFDEPEDGILYRVTMPVRTSGTAFYRVAQKA